MKQVPLKIGAKGLGAVKVPLNVPETIDELTTAAKNSPEVVVRWAKRGFAIEHQERSGARETFREMKQSGADDAAIQAAVAEKVNSYDPTAVKPRTSSGTSRKPKQVTVKSGPNGKAPSLADFLAQLKAQGVNVSIDDGSGTPAEPAAASA